MREPLTKWGVGALILLLCAGVTHGPLWLLASVAPDSRNMEAKAEVRLRLQHRWAVVEPRFWVGWHTMAEEIGGYAYGLSIMVGASR
jgi:hypothetical protein